MGGKYDIGLSNSVSMPSTATNNSPLYVVGGGAQAKQQSTLQYLILGVAGVLAIFIFRRLV